MAKYQVHKNQNLFDAQDTIQSLSAMGNPLEIAKEYVDFEAFRNILKTPFSPRTGKAMREDHPSILF